MDFSMPGISGLQATRIIHAELPDTRIIGLSMFGDFEYAEAMFIAGAAAYIAKGCPPETVLNAIRACRPDCRKWAETPPAPLKSSST
jgi:DNA-binding NarL/FixJ family response regulator